MQDGFTFTPEVLEFLEMYPVSYHNLRVLEALEPFPAPRPRPVLLYQAAVFAGLMEWAPLTTRPEGGGRPWLCSLPPSG